jgi:hypothetical protein
MKIPWVVAVAIAVASCTDGDGTSESVSQLCRPEEGGAGCAGDAKTKASNKSRTRAAQVHPGVAIHRVDADCIQQGNAFACQVSVEFSGVSFVLECDWLVYDDGTVTGDCYTFDDVVGGR